MSSAIPHVISFLTRPLLAAFPPASVTSAQLILTASLGSTPSATFTLSAASNPPAPLFAAALGAGIPWAAWCTALAGGRDVPVLLIYGPGFLKARIGAAPVADVWTADARGNTARIAQAKLKVGAPLLQQSTGARLRGALLSARVRQMRRLEALPTADSDDCTSDSESDSGASTSSQFSASSAESRTSAASSPAASPKAVLVALPSSGPATALYRAPKGTYRAPTLQRTRTPAQATTPAPAKAAATAYLYQGGVTRVMTGGVMLGCRA